MIDAKGIADAVAAVRRARALGAPVELDLYGAPDPSNRRSCSEADLRQWSAEPGIRWHGATDRRRGGLAHASRRDAADLVSRGRAAQPDRGGGLRPADRDHRLARAAAIWCATGSEGILVPLRDTEAAARALVELAGDADLRARLGRAAHARFQERFTEAEVRRAVGSVYAGFGL